ncbi:uncharacterized protein LOC143026181 [Oratosquilla oratoria]|uniref:uncharacterized protein LOC143026181 n=1 Tax=Oratosquilla oratoria TaxID=337810 RepID=UPI003F75E003
MTSFLYSGSLGAWVTSVLVLQLVSDFRPREVVSCPPPWSAFPLSHTSSSHDHASYKDWAAMTARPEKLHCIFQESNPGIPRLRLERYSLRHACTRPLQRKERTFFTLVLSVIVLCFLLQGTNIQEKITRNSSWQNASLKEDADNTQHVPAKEEAVPNKHWMKAPNHFLIAESDFCDRHPDLQIIGYVHSSISATKKRNVTRKTWANTDILKEHNINMAVVFVVGRPKNQEEERIVQEESRLHGDLVQGDFEDERMFLSYKALTAMIWISRHCSRVPWTLHADDNVLIDPFLLKAKITDIQTMGVVDHFYCHIFNNMQVAREGEWRVAPEDFSKEFYPTYCSGSMWFVPTPVVPRLLEASRTADFVWVDDAYLTGIVAEKAGVGHTQAKFNSLWEFQSIKYEDVDKKLVWIPAYLEREFWWRKIVLHQKLKTGEPWRDDPNANPVLPRRIEDVPFGQPPSIPTRFLIEEADFCTEERNPRLRMIGFVISSISAVEKRATTRGTWASSDIPRKYGINMAAVFIVGRTKNEKEEQILEEESLRYHDIIQADLEDQYNLLTYKTLAALVWVHRHCSHVPWTFKADDDILVDDFLFDKKIKDIETLGVGNQFYCYVHQNSEVLREGKWGVHRDEFPEDQYPPYCEGPMWFMPTTIVPRLLAAAQATNFLRIEDAYITGLVARQSGIGHTPLRFTRFWRFFEDIVDEDFDKVLVWEFRHQDRIDSWPRLVQYHLSK